jgi:hypothetical protein
MVVMCGGGGGGGGGSCQVIFHDFISLYYRNWNYSRSPTRFVLSSRKKIKLCLMKTS